MLETNARNQVTGSITFVTGAQTTGHAHAETGDEAVAAIKLAAVAATK